MIPTPTSKALPTRTLQEAQVERFPRREDLRLVAGYLPQIYQVAQALEGELLRAVGDNLEGLQVVASLQFELQQLAKVEHYFHAIFKTVDEITTVAENIEDVQTVASRLDDALLVLDALPDITLVVENLKNINALALRVGVLDSVSNNMPAITTVATNIGAIIKAADIYAELTVLASDIEEAVVKVLSTEEVVTGAKEEVLTQANEVRRMYDELHDLSKSLNESLVEVDAKLVEVDELLKEVLPQLDALPEQITRLEEMTTTNQETYEDIRTVAHTFNTTADEKISVIKDAELAVLDAANDVSAAVVEVNDINTRVTSAAAQVEEDALSVSTSAKVVEDSLIVVTAAETQVVNLAATVQNDAQVVAAKVESVRDTEATMTRLLEDTTTKVDTFNESSAEVLEALNTYNENYEDVQYKTNELIGLAEQVTPLMEETVAASEKGLDALRAVQETIAVAYEHNDYMSYTNRIIYDAQGNPNVMVWIPRFENEGMASAINANRPDLTGGRIFDLGTGVHPAFNPESKNLTGFWYGKHLLGRMGTGTACVAGLAPYTGVNFNNARTACTNKGTGWFMSSVHARAAVILLGMADGHMIEGNTEYGRTLNKVYKASRRSDNAQVGDVSGFGTNLAGSGHISWSHDNKPTGVYDLVGNVWEWQDCVYLENGAVRISPDGQHGITENATNFDTGLWLSRTNGITITNTGQGSVSTSSTSLPAGTISRDVQSHLMAQLLMDCGDLPNVDGTTYMINSGIRRVAMGGAYNAFAHSGSAAVTMNNTATVTSGAIGVRAMYIE